MNTALIDFAVRDVRARNSPRRWTSEEDKIVYNLLPVMEIEEIARQIGRSPNAVQIRMVRHGIPRPTRRGEVYSAHQAGRMIGLDVHAMMMLIRQGKLPAQILPGQRGIMIIRRIDLWLFCIKPDNWIYFKAHRIRPESLQRLVLMRQAKWDDEWWSTGQIARYYGLKNSNSVATAIFRGKLPAVRWGNWYVKKSDVLARPFYPQKGCAGIDRGDWTPAGDAFLLKARDEWGKSWAEIGRMMKWTHQRAAYRYQVLKRRQNKAGRI